MTKQTLAENKRNLSQSLTDETEEKLDSYIINNLWYNWMNLNGSHSNCACSYHILFSSIAFHRWHVFNYPLSIVDWEDPVFIAEPDTTQKQGRINGFNIWSASCCYLPIILNSISKKYNSSISLIEHHPYLLMTVMLSVSYTINELFSLAFAFQCIS